MSRSIYAQLHRRFGPRESESSRRDFLKGVAAAGAALLLASCTSQEEKVQQLAARKRVIVVGGGFAGLACAHQLRMAGYQVKIIEARDRLGGRVLSLKDFIPKRVVEGGGELIGTNHPLWVAYAKQFQLDLTELPEDDALNSPLILEGKVIGNEEAKKLYNELTAALNLMNDDARKVDEDEPWNTPDAAILDARTTGDWLKSIEASHLCKVAIAAQLEANNGVPMQMQSYLGNLAQIKGGGVEKYWTDSENRHCNQGNQELAHRLAENIGAENLFLSTAVGSITITAGGVEIKATDGPTFQADDVVLAVPPTIWTNIKFSPLLPGELNPQMGIAVKYLAMVKSRFWKDAKLSPMALTDGAASMTWESTNGQEGDAPAGLTVFSGGPAADTCRKIPTDDRDDAYAKALEKLYPGFIQQFVRSRFMDWPSDKLTRCSFSFPAPGQITAMGKTLRDGVGRLHFAGEHTCYKFVGYMEGALQSGVRVATTIASRDGVLTTTRPAVSA